MVILGGANDYDEDFCDGWVFNSKTETMKQVIKPAANYLKFNCESNQSFMSS